MDTIFFGGGTPSLTSHENLRRIVDALHRSFAIRADVEFSLEANPEDLGTAQPRNLATWRDLGVNRLSIGVQSLHDRELRPIGRVHGRERAREEVAAAVASGIRTSVDLILGLPHQTADSFRESLELAIDAGVGHLSLYMLDLEEGTALARHVGGGRIALPDEDLVASLYVEAVARLERAGLAQYEISNFGDRCLHNLKYWRREPYLGFGLGAHSFAGGRRFANTREIARYIAGDAPLALDETLGAAEEKHETIFLHLRQSGGIDYERLVELCGQEGMEWTDRGLQDGWLRRSGSRVAFTPSGFLLSNDYIAQLF